MIKRTVSHEAMKKLVVKNTTEITCIHVCDTQHNATRNVIHSLLQRKQPTLDVAQSKVASFTCIYI